MIVQFVLESSYGYPSFLYTSSLIDGRFVLLSASVNEF